MTTATTVSTTEMTLVAFRIGRGGRFYNAGHLSYVGQNVKIDNYTSDLFTNFENINKVSHEIGKTHPNLIDLLQKATEDKAATERLKNWGLDLGNLVYTDGNGNSVGLNVDNDGTGVINIDNNYDTTYVKSLKDCSETELQLIYDSEAYVSSDVKEHCKNALNIEEFEEKD